MVRTYGLTHVALSVKDAQRSLRFYRDVFGMVEVYNQDGFVQAGSPTRVFQRVGVEIQTPGTRDVLVFDEHAPRKGKPGGVAHFGFRLVDPAVRSNDGHSVSAAGPRIR